MKRAHKQAMSRNAFEHAPHDLSKMDALEPCSLAAATRTVTSTRTVTGITPAGATASTPTASDSDLGSHALVRAVVEVGDVGNLVILLKIVEIGLALLGVEVEILAINLTGKGANEAEAVPQADNLAFGSPLTRVATWTSATAASSGRRAAIVAAHLDYKRQ